MAVIEDYTLKEIIIGLREEYQKCENQLAGLRALCFVDRKKVEDFRFEIEQTDSKEINLYCVLTKRQNLLEKFETKLGLISNVEERGRFKIKNGIDYFENQNALFPIVVSNINQDDFTSRTFKILKSDFTKNIKTKYIKLKLEEKDIELYLDHNKVDVKIKDSKEQDKEINIKYNALTDSIKISSASLTSEIDYLVIDSLLNLEIPRDSLPEYHRQVIDSNARKSKNVIIEEQVNKSKVLNFQIFDESYKILLVPVTLKESSYQRKDYDGKEGKEKQLRKIY